MSDPLETMTAAQRERLAAELAELEGPMRTAAVEAIKTAREFGDLSENFEYHAAKSEQGMLERRITILRERLQGSVVVEADESGRVGVGCVVEIEDEGGEKMSVEISRVGGAGALSPESPLGSALLGAAPGETVKIVAPSGDWHARVVSVRQA